MFPEKQNSLLVQAHVCHPLGFRFTEDIICILFLTLKYNIHHMGVTLAEL